MSETNNSKKEVVQKSVSVEQLLVELDDIVNWFNQADIPIDQATAKFDRGIELANKIKRSLSDSETKINQIRLKLDKLQD